MAKRKKRRDRDIEKSYPLRQLAAKLRRWADCIERRKPFRIQIAGQRVAVPPHATLSIEHEREANHEEIEFQVKWRS